MKPTRFALSLRTLMFVILVIGLIACGWVLSSRSRQYQLQANRWQHAAAASRQHVSFCQQKIAGILMAAKRLRLEARNMDRPEVLARKNADDWIWWRANLADAEARVAYSEMLQHKYELAVQFPWFIVEPDPPMPTWCGRTDGATDEDLAALERESSDSETAAR